MTLQASFDEGLDDQKDIYILNTIRGNQNDEASSSNKKPKSMSKLLAKKKDQLPLDLESIQNVINKLSHKIIDFMEISARGLSIKENIKPPFRKKFQNKFTPLINVLVLKA